MNPRLAKIKLKIILPILVIAITVGCQDEHVAPINEPNPLMGYLTSFLEEAEKRGALIDTTGIILELGTPLGKEACGWGSPRKPGFSPIVRICETCACWRNGDNYYKNELLFHEFGHALLSREHDNSTLPNGSRRSIMNATYIGVFLQSEERVKYYIDELFDPSTPVPDWAK